MKDWLLSEDESGVYDLHTTCNKSDGDGNDFEGKPVLLATVSINRIGNVDSKRGYNLSKVQ